MGWSLEATPAMHCNGKKPRPFDRGSRESSNHRTVLGPGLQPVGMKGANKVKQDAGHDGGECQNIGGKKNGGHGWFLSGPAAGRERCGFSDVEIAGIFCDGGEVKIHVAAP